MRLFHIGITQGGEVEPPPGLVTVMREGDRQQFGAVGWGFGGVAEVVDEAEDVFDHSCFVAVVGGDVGVADVRDAGVARLEGRCRSGGSQAWACVCMCRCRCILVPGENNVCIRVCVSNRHGKKATIFYFSFASSFFL